MKNIKSFMLVGLFIIGQSAIASDSPKVPSDWELDVMKGKRTLYAEVAAGSAATVACGVSIAIAFKNKGGANAGSYIGCAALYTALRQAVNMYQIDKEIEAAEVARKIAVEQEKNSANQKK